ncbi:TetR family transcriptional regulator C-terminal domain-containing protein [Thermocatellispora tengchongensis]|uniref:TetR family transcriptional regulator C-terminal domain-containing protein n=1 Tax=Thermocatellispora tengchongensis TaxID=1073253 RepID=UPI0036355F98
MAGRDPGVTDLVRAIFGRMEAAFRDALERARHDGEIAADRDPAVLARYLLNSMYGLRVLGKTAGRASMIDIVETTLTCL